MAFSRAFSVDAPRSRGATGDTPDLLGEIAMTQAEIAQAAPDPLGLMQMIAARTQHLTGADGAMVELLEGGLVECRAAVGSLGSRLNTRRVAPELPEAANVSSLSLTVPVVSGERTIGLLRLVASVPSSFDEQDLRIASVMAGILGAALQHAQELEGKKALLAECTRALEAFRESEARFRGAFDNAAIGKSLMGLDGRWLGVNRAICNILGYAEEELLATDFQTLTCPEDLGTDLGLMQQLHCGDIENYQLHKRYIHKQGHQVWALLTVSIVRGPAGEPLYYVSEIQDMTEQQNIQAALRLSEQEYRATFELGGIGKVQVDVASGAVLRANRKFSEILALHPDETVGVTLESFVHPEGGGALPEAMREMRDGTLTSFTVETRCIRRDGGQMWVSIDAAVLPGRAGSPVRAVASVQNVTEQKLFAWLEEDRRKVLELAVKDRPLPEVLDQLARTVDRQLGDTCTAVMILQDDNLALVGPTVPSEWRVLLGDTTHQVVAKLTNSTWGVDNRCGVCHLQTDPAWHEQHLLAAQHGFRAAWTFPIQTAENAAIGFLVIFSGEERSPNAIELNTLNTIAKLGSISVEHHNTTRQLSHLVRHDALTGMPNRTLYEDRLQQALVFAQRTKKTVALFALDIDKFKSINDSHGHGAGDHLLRQFALRLRSRLRQSDTMARIGGDEFVIVLPELAGHGEAAAVAQKLLESLVEPFSIPGVTRPVRVTTSIGIALFPDHGDTPSAIHQRADMALYRVKELGRNGYSF